MPIIVNSPYSGQPVKLRDQDVGRAVRDEENRVFYVLERSDGSGYYGAMTRQGGLKDEQRYDEMAGKMQQSEHHVQDEAVEHTQATAKHKGGKGKLVIFVLFVIVVALGYYFFVHLKGQWNKGPEAGKIELGQRPAIESVLTDRLESQLT